MILFTSPIQKLLWRGSTTGGYFSADNADVIFNTQRTRLVKQAHESSGQIAILEPTLDAETPVGVAKNYSLSAINQEALDIGFAGVPAQCDGEFCDKGIGT